MRFTLISVVDHYSQTRHTLTEDTSHHLLLPIIRRAAAFNLALSLLPITHTLLTPHPLHRCRKAWRVFRHLSLGHPMVIRRMAMAMANGHLQLYRLPAARLPRRDHRRSCSRGVAERTYIHSRPPHTLRRQYASVLELLSQGVNGDIVYKALLLLFVSHPLFLHRCYPFPSLFSPTSVLHILFPFKLLTMDEYLQYFDTHTLPPLWRYFAVQSMTVCLRINGVGGWSGSRGLGDVRGSAHRRVMIGSTPSRLRGSTGSRLTVLFSNGIYTASLAEDGRPHLSFLPPRAYHGHLKETEADRHHPEEYLRG